MSDTVSAVVGALIGLSIVTIRGLIRERRYKADLTRRRES